MPTAVPPPSLPILAALLLLGAVPACVSIDGGAVEVSWVIRSAEGRAITDCACAEPQIAQVRLDLRRAPDDGSPVISHAFPCRRQTGATPFNVAAGSYEISVTALDGAGTPLPGVATPAPILRDVVHGQPTEVEALPLVAQCAAVCAGTNKNGVCTRQ